MTKPENNPTIPYPSEVDLAWAAGIIDGVVRWQIKRAIHEPPSGDRYIIGCRAGLLLSIAPLLYLSVPLELHPIVVPLWGCLLALSLILLAANLQHQV